MTLRIGILGAARVARYALVEPAKSVEGVGVVAVGARDPARAHAFAAEHGIARAYGDYQSVIDDPDVDLVYIATPPSVHVEQALAVVAAGKAALVEKPFALNAADAARVHRAAKRAGVHVFEAMHSLHHALFARILAILADGQIGHLREIDATFEAAIDPDDPLRWTPQLGGGALMDLGVYPLAWVRRIVGEHFAVTECDALMRGGVDASFSARLAFDDGPICRIGASMLTDPPAAHLRIVGSAGELRVRNPLVPQLGHKLTIVTASGERTEQVEGPSSYAAQLIAVRDTLVAGRRFPLPDADYVASMTAIESVRARWQNQLQLR